MKKMAKATSARTAYVWWKHLRSYYKKRFNRAARRYAKESIQAEREV